MNISIVKVISAAAVGAFLSACDGVPIKPYPLTAGSPDATLKIVNASGAPLRYLSIEGCYTFAQETFLVDGGVYKQPGVESWSLPADSGKCMLVTAYVNSRDAWFSDKFTLAPGQTYTVNVQ